MRSNGQGRASASTSAPAAPAARAWSAGRNSTALGKENKIGPSSRGKSQRVDGAPFGWSGSGSLRAEARIASWTRRKTGRRGALPFDAHLAGRSPSLGRISASAPRREMGAVLAVCEGPKDVIRRAACRSGSPLGLPVVWDAFEEVSDLSGRRTALLRGRVLRAGGEASKPAGKRRSGASRPSHPASRLDAPSDGPGGPQHSSITTDSDSSTSKLPFSYEASRQQRR